MMKTVFAAGALTLAAISAQAAAPVITPKEFVAGTSIHVTPRDQDGNPFPSNITCVLEGLPSSIVMTKDSTGYSLTSSVVQDTNSIIRWRCTDGAKTIYSSYFRIRVTLPPWSATEVGDTVP